MKLSTCREAVDEVHWSTGHPRVALCVCKHVYTLIHVCDYMNKDNVYQKRKKSSSVINKSSCRETVKRRLNLQKNRPALGFLE